MWRPGTQPSCNKPFRSKRLIVFAGALLIFFGLNVGVHAQAPHAPPAILGQIVGEDISVIGTSHVIPGSGGQAIEFSSGGTIVVFSGKARVEFTGGGELYICGPSKFTVLSSGQALTVALSFGRVRIRFDALRPISIYMPLVIATPIPIGSQSRDATVGLTNTGTMCVLAANGAIRLQNQLSGDTAIVPQPSEVFVPGSSFASLPPAVGQCGCNFDEPLVQQTPPVDKAPMTSHSSPRAETVPPQQTPGPTVAPNSPIPPILVSSAPHPAQPVGTSTLPALKIAAPPIAYDAKSATESPEPISVATLLLAQQAVVEPEWIFHGTVIDPKVSIDRKTRKNHQPNETSAVQNSVAQPRHKRRGFWAKFRHFFTGSS